MNSEHTAVPETILEKLTKVKLLSLDVDGVLTDGVFITSMMVKHFENLMLRMVWG